MKLVVLSLICSSFVVISYQLSLCCPIHWKLVQVQNDSFNTNKYECVDATESINDESLTLETRSQPQLLGYNIQQIYGPPNITVAIPQCLHDYSLHMLRYGRVSNIPKNSCLTTFNGRPIALHCALLNLNESEEVGAVQKCCPRNYSFSAEMQKCVSRQVNFDIYEQIFNHTVIFANANMKCSLNNALVEHTLTAEMFEFAKNQIILKQSGRKYEMRNFCIEAIIDDYNLKNIKNDLNNSLLPVSSLNDLKFLIRTCDSREVCKHMACIRKCCEDGEIYARQNGSTHCKAEVSDSNLISFQSMDVSGNFTKPLAFGVLHGLDCPKFRLDPDSYSDEAHTISSTNGSLYVSSTKKKYTNNQYCIERTHNISKKMYTFLCFDSKVVGNDSIRFKLYPIGLLISCCFYVITLIVYISISRLRNLPGKILICLVISLLLAYFGIALGQLMPTSNDDFCFASGFFVYFCLMAAFSWMNVMCFDIWQTFGSTRKRGIKKNQTKRFVLYSTYGWGLPSVLTTVTISLTVSNVLNDNFRPNFGHGRCWFTYDSVGFANLLFFSGPVGILFLINFVLFVLTLRYCNRVKREIFRMQSSNCEKPALRRRFFVDKARFAMNTKLFVVMGITWLLELLSIVFYDHKKIFFWAISDSFNVLLGVFVFFIFVFKEKIWYAVLERLGIKRQEGMQRSATTTCVTQSTCAATHTERSLQESGGKIHLLREQANRTTLL